MSELGIRACLEYHEHEPAYCLKGLLEQLQRRRSFDELAIRYCILQFLGPHHSLPVGNLSVPGHLLMLIARLKLPLQEQDLYSMGSGDNLLRA